MTQGFDETRRPIDRRRTVEIRPAVRDDAASIDALSTGHIAGKAEFIAESFTRRHVLGSYAGERIVGFAIWDRSFFGRPFIWLLGVEQRLRRRGIGLQLLHAVSSACLGESLFTSTNESNLGMQALLTRAGFTRTGSIENLDPGDPEIFYLRTAARW